MKLSPIYVLTVWALLGASGAVAEDATVLKEGTRVRIRAGNVREIPGVITMWSDGWKTPGKIIANNDALVAVQIPGQEEPWCLPLPGHALTGEFVAVDGEAWAIRVDGQPAPFKVPRNVIAGIDVSSGRRSRGRGALIGAAAGAGAGILIGFASGSDPVNAFIPVSAGAKAAGFGISLGAIGALIGVAVPPGEQWIGVPLHRIQLGLQPIGGRCPGVSLTLRF